MIYDSKSSLFLDRHAVIIKSVCYTSAHGTVVDAR